jgi:hypothetical protein
MRHRGALMEGNDHMRLKHLAALMVVVAGHNMACRMQFFRGQRGICTGPGYVIGGLTYCRRFGHRAARGQSVGG